MPRMSSKVAMAIEIEGNTGLPAECPTRLGAEAKRLYDFIRGHGKGLFAPVDAPMVAQLCEAVAEMRRMSMPSSKKKPTLAQRVELTKLLMAAGLSEPIRAKLARGIYAANAKRMGEAAPKRGASKVKSRILRAAT